MTVTQDQAKIVMAAIDELATIVGCSKHLQAFQARANACLPALGNDGKQIHNMDELIKQFQKNFDDMRTSNSYPAFYFHDLEIGLIRHACEEQGLDWNAVKWGSFKEENLDSGRNWFNVKEIRELANEQPKATLWDQGRCLLGQLKGLTRKSEQER